MEWVKSRPEAIGMPFPRTTLLYPMTAETTVDIKEYSKLQAIVNELRDENSDLTSQLQKALHLNKDLEHKVRMPQDFWQKERKILLIEPNIVRK